MQDSRFEMQERRGKIPDGSFEGAGRGPGDLFDREGLTNGQDVLVLKIALQGQKPTE